MKYADKNEFIKEKEVPLLNFEEGPGVLLLNFRGVPGPTFKLWGGPRSWVPGYWGPWSWDPGPTFTPCQIGQGGQKVSKVKVQLPWYENDVDSLTQLFFPAVSHAALILNWDLISLQFMDFKVNLFPFFSSPVLPFFLFLFLFFFSVYCFFVFNN